MKKLSRNEMKNVLGGRNQCKVVGDCATWTCYTDPIKVNGYYACILGTCTYGVCP